MGKNSRIAAATAKIRSVTSDRHETTEIATPTKPSFLPPLPSEVVAQREAEAGVVMSDEERLAAIQAAAEETPTIPVAVTDPPVIPKQVVGRRIRYNTTDIIVVRKSNPKRPGTAGHARYAVYQTGMVVEDYMKHKAVGKFARADLAWDLDRKFIDIVPATELAEALKQEHVPAPVVAAEVTEVAAEPAIG